jgi:hypothetical protein
MLNKNDLEELRALATRTVILVGIQTYGAKTLGLSRTDIADLVSAGLLSNEAAANIDPIKDAYVFGRIRANMAAEGITEMNSLSLSEMRRLARLVPLTEVQKTAIEYARKRAAEYVGGMVQRADEEVVKMAQGYVNPEVELTGDAAEAQREIIREEIAEGMVRRESASQIAGKIGRRTGDWDRNWKLVAQNEITAAHEQGIADWIEKYDGEDALVAKMPSPQACNTCRKLFLDETGKPKVFKLSELQANGTNVGRKKADWRPTVGPAHMNCACTLLSTPEGTHFNDAWQLVSD